MRPQVNSLDMIEIVCHNVTDMDGGSKPYCREVYGLEGEANLDEPGSGQNTLLLSKLLKNSREVTI